MARYLEQRIKAEPKLELLAPVSLNIVCFRYRYDPSVADRLNADIAVALQESGIAAPSTTFVSGRLAIRAAIVNHRTRREDLDALMAATLKFGAALCQVRVETRNHFDTHRDQSNQTPKTIVRRHWLASRR